MPKRTVNFFPWFVCSLGAIFYCYEYLLRILPSLMTDDLLGSFNISAVALGNLIAFYYYAYTPMQLPVGIMMDRFGPRRLLVFASVVCTIGTYLFAQHYLLIAQAGRCLTGLGSAFAFIGVLKLASIWLPPSRFAFVSGIILSFGMIGAMLGDIVLSKLLVSIGTNSTLTLAAAIGLILTVVMWVVIPNRSDAKTEISSLAPQTTYREFFQAVFKLIKNPQMWIIGIIGCLLYLSLSAFAEAWAVSFLQRVYGLSHVLAATNASLVFFGWAIGAPLVGWISDRINNRCYPIVLGALFGALFFSIIIFFPNIASHYLKLLLFLCGVCSSVQIIVFVIAKEINGIDLAGTALAVTNTLVMVGGAIFQPIMGEMLDVFSHSTVKSGLGVLSKIGFQYTLSIIPMAFVISALLAIFIKRKQSITNLTAC